MIDLLLGGRTIDPRVRAAAERALPALDVRDPARSAV
jgi:hypothetical protein